MRAPDPIFQLLYFSEAVDGIGQSDLEDILQTSRRKNEAARISGLLLVNGGHFMQVLEGRREDVEALYEVIKADPRHRKVTTIYTVDQKQRQFQGWAMAHYEFRPDDEELLRSFVRICGQADPGAVSYPDDDEAQAFVAAFRSLL